jgi:hypothetical protein
MKSVKTKTGAIIADGTLYNPKKPNENFLNKHSLEWNLLGS